jgi:hypothetical protein
MSLVYFKKNVPYVIGIRYFIGDNKGKTLTDEDPYIAIDKEDERDFRRANKQLLDPGILIPTSEPAPDEESPNAVTDEKAIEIVKNVFILKKALVDITSASMVAKLLAVANEQKRPKKTIDIITKRLEELADEETPKFYTSNMYVSPEASKSI